MSNLNIWNNSARGMCTRVACYLQKACVSRVLCDNGPEKCTEHNPYCTSGTCEDSMPEVWRPVFAAYLKRRISSC